MQEKRGSNDSQQQQETLQEAQPQAVSSVLCAVICGSDRHFVPPFAQLSGETTPSFFVSGNERLSSKSKFRRKTRHECKLNWNKG